MTPEKLAKGSELLRYIKEHKEDVSNIKKLLNGGAHSHDTFIHNNSLALTSILIPKIISKKILELTLEECEKNLLELETSFAKL